MIAERYQVTYPFLLYAGRISPHKERRAHDRGFLRAENGTGKRSGLFPDLKLIIIGDDVSGNP
jgi:hypothetical protein